ncbi:hypothetical protein N9A94_01940 [Akkermansiaceae bacterium]|nr:hypothetical protein [Akkermansiaceae bacterium]
MKSAALMAHQGQRNTNDAIASRYLRMAKHCLFFDQTKGDYLLKQGSTINPDKGIRIRIKAKLKQLGIQNIDAKIAALLSEVVSEKSITRLGPIAGYKTGTILDCAGGKLLVTGQAQEVQPSKGKWTRIETLVTSLLGPEQALVYFAWVQTQLIAVRSGAHFPAPLLAIVGESDDGKSLLAAITVEILGGRSINPLGAWTSKGAVWNNQLLEAETLLIDDSSHRDDRRGRNELASEFKEAIYGGKVTIRKRHTTDFTCRPVWNVMIVCNADSEAIRVIPDPFLAGFNDKLVLLKTSKGDVFLREAGDSAREKRWAAYMQELPAFAYYLLEDFEIPSVLPDGIKKVRGGLLYQHPDTLKQWRAASPEGHLAAIIEDYIAKNSVGGLSTTSGELTTSGVREVLSAEGGYTVSLPKTDIALGQQLGRLAKEGHPNIRKAGLARSGAVLWKIGQFDDAPDSEADSGVALPS